MLIFAAFTPHPLLSIPEIGKAHVAKLRQTMRSFKILAQELYAAQPDTVIVLSPHTSYTDQRFTTNQRPDVWIDFKKFGNLSDRVLLHIDVGFGYRVKEALETTFPIFSSDDEVLDYGAAIPLFHLTRYVDREKVRIVPIGLGVLPLEQHYRFGEQVNRHIHQSTRRIAIIASGDLSHGASKHSVVPYNARAYMFNKLIRDLIERRDTKAMMNITESDLADIHECGLRPLVTLLGVMHERQYTPLVMSYEAAVGVGYMTVNFQLR